MSKEHGHLDPLLTPLEQHIVEIVAELSAAIAELVVDDDDGLPLAEFDQRLLLEHAQIISRYVLAQAAARAYPNRYRLIGGAVPDSPVAKQTHDGEGHGRDEGEHRHYSANPATARETHRRGRAIIGEHPWEHEHEHTEGHSHADEWEWEPIDEDTAGQ